jgi:hypothetical protein
MVKRLGLLMFVASVLAAAVAVPSLAANSSKKSSQPRLSNAWINNPKARCPYGPTCTEIYGWQRYYSGHDEPSVLFYSNKNGAGNNMTYQLYLPKDPPKAPPKGTPNFELHVAFWFGMAMCDTQSAPNPGGSSLGPQKSCKRDSDSNIYNSKNPKSKKYMGLHPGTAFMEMQFYPPGWVLWPAGVSCDSTKWCAALNIDSYSQNENTGVANNTSCLDTVGIEPVNFAFITKNGQSQAPANPVDATNATYTPDPSKDLFMKSGDHLSVAMHDTSNGLKINIKDKTTGQSGSMTASPANGFGQVNFQPSASTCTVTPYAFHPMYSTSSTKTRVIWAAHSYNIAFADEIGHFEYCDNHAVVSGTCVSSKRTDPDGVDGDDTGCFGASKSSLFHVSGCIGTDVDFDGTPYLKDWPGSSTKQKTNNTLFSTPIRFSSPLIAGKTPYSSIAFEANLPRIEQYTTPPCQRHVSNPRDPHPGAGCVNPPRGSKFYPFFSTLKKGASCTWVEGGPHIAGTSNTFGGSSKTEFGTKAKGNLLDLYYPSTPDKPEQIYEDFRHILSSNPCPG